MFVEQSCYVPFWIFVMATKYVVVDGEYISKQQNVSEWSDVKMKSVQSRFIELYLDTHKRSSSSYLPLLPLAPRRHRSTAPLRVSWEPEVLTIFSTTRKYFTEGEQPGVRRRCLSAPTHRMTQRGGSPSERHRLGGRGPFLTIVPNSSKIMSCLMILQLSLLTIDMLHPSSS